MDSVVILVACVRIILFFDFFASNFFDRGYFYRPIQITANKLCVSFIIPRPLPDCTRA